MSKSYGSGFREEYPKAYKEGMEKAASESIWTIIKMVFLDRIGKNKPG